MKHEFYGIGVVSGDWFMMGVGNGELGVRVGTMLIGGCVPEAVGCGVPVTIEVGVDGTGVGVRIDRV